MNENKKVVIVVDMINGFCKEGALHDKNILGIVPNIIRELNKVDTMNRIFIADTHTNDSTEFSTFPSHCLVADSESDIISELLPFVDKNTNTNTLNVVNKNSTNACWVINMNHLAHTYDEFIITGCCTDICVLQFALGLKTYLNQLNINKEVIVPKDCVATYNIPNVHDAKEYQDFSLLLMNNAGIKIQ